MLWTWNILATVGLSGVVGLVLGLVGGGGSIVTVPVLVYVAGLPPADAVALSLPVVGTTAAFGALLHLRRGNADLRAAAVFAVTGMAGAFLGAPLTRLAPGPVLLLLFAALMAAVGVRMLPGGRSPDAGTTAGCRPLVCGGAGLGIGILTGFLGVGGGFLIVPALLRFARSPMHRAVGTSLLVIAANSAAGFAAHLSQAAPHLPLAAALTGAALVGMVGGTLLGRRLRPQSLKNAFAGVALAVAAYLFVVNLGPGVELLAR